MNIKCELRTKRNRVIMDKIASLSGESKPLACEIPIRYMEVLNQVQIFGEGGLSQLNGKTARQTLPLIIKCVQNLELGVNVYGELDAIKRLREMATTEPDAIWHIEM